MSDLRQAAEAVLDAWFRSGSKILEMRPHMEALAGALEQPPEERNFCPRCGKRALGDVHTCTPPQAEPDLFRCPKCGGPADNCHDREVPPNPYWCSKCMTQDDWK